MFRSGISSLNFVIFFLELYNVFFFNQHFRFLLAMQVVVYMKIFPEQFVILVIKHFFKFLMEEGMNIYIFQTIFILKSLKCQVHYFASLGIVSFFSTLCICLMGIFLLGYRRVTSLKCVVLFLVIFLSHTLFFVSLHFLK